MPTQAAASGKRMHDLPGHRAAASPTDPDPVRDQIMEAMLAAAGELGFRQVAVRDVLERYGGHRIQFWQRFASKEECFEAAYAVWAERLVGELLTTALAESEWRGGMRAGLLALAEFVERRPELARALLIEAEIAGGAALAKREEMIERLGEAIDVAREQAAPDERPPPLTGVFLAGGIAAFLSEQLAAGTPEGIWKGLPELMRFATAPFFGEEAAEAEFEAARALLEGRADGEEPG